MLLICKNILFLILFLLFHSILTSQRVLIIVFFKVSFLWLLVLFFILSAFHLVGLSLKKKSKTLNLSFIFKSETQKRLTRGPLWSHKALWPLEFNSQTECLPGEPSVVWVWGWASFPSPSGRPLRFSRERCSNPLLGGYKCGSWSSRG